MNLFLDTETNGRKPEQICQLSVVEECSGALRGHNWFFRVDTMNDYAYAKHGFSLDFLRKVSRGRSFADCAERVRAVLDRPEALLVAHNANSDIRMLALEFKRGDGTYRPRRTLDTMNGFAHAVQARTKSGKPKKPTLAELGAHYGVSGAEVDDLCASLFGVMCEAHDARYDAALTYLAVRNASDRGDIRGVF